MKAGSRVYLGVANTQPKGDQMPNFKDLGGVATCGFFVCLPFVVFGTLPVLVPGMLVVLLIASIVCWRL